jgi:AbrB family looped-hinge helix DNA binding protein
MLHKAKIAKGGKISIPSACRKYLNLKDGEEVVFNLREGEIVLSPLRLALERARKTVNKYHPTNKSLVDKLLLERRNEAKDE